MEPFPHHRGKLGISHEFGIPDPDLGTSLREHLQGQPWERHVAEGEAALVRHGFDPAAMRAETRAIFEQRLAQHDARFRSNGVSLEIGAGIAIGSSALHVSTDGRERTVQPGANFLGSIKSIDGDIVTQNLGRGQTTQWSLHELRSQFSDPSAFDAAMKPGNMVKLRLVRMEVSTLNYRHRVSRGNRLEVNRCRTGRLRKALNFRLVSRGNVMMSATLERSSHGATRL